MNYNSIVIIKKLDAENDPETLKQVDKVVSAAHKYNLKIEEDPSKATSKTIFIAIGGDGTMLYAMQHALKTNSAVFGVHTGNVGFLTDFLPMSFEMALGMAIRGNIIEEARTVLSVQVSDETFIAVNDFVVSNLYSDYMINYDLCVGGNYAGRHRANSVIVSTPTGSTAYALSTGGAIIEPDLDIMEIVPVAPCTLTSRPIIVAGKKEIEVFVYPKRPGEVISLKADGQQVATFDLTGKEELKIVMRRHENRPIILHNPAWNFYDVLTNKLKWNA